MTITLNALLNPPTKDEILTGMLELAVILGFPVSAWQSGSVPRTLLEVDAETFEGLFLQSRDSAAGGLLDLSTGDWLTLTARGFFGLERGPGLLTTGTIRLTCSAAAGPYTIAPRELWVSDALGRRYTNTSGGVLASGGTLDLTAEAEFVGAAYNVAINTITILVTARPGVTVTNPDTGGGTWIATSGADVESDAALTARCRARWGTQGTGSTASAYEFWARTASAEVRRVVVREHDNLGTDTDGHVTVVLAGASGTVSAAAVTAVETYIATQRPLCSSVHVVSATVITFTVTGTLFLRAGSLASLVTAKTNVQSLGESLRIGETVHRAALIEQAMLPTGAFNFALTSPAVDTPLAWNETPIFDPNAIVAVEVP